MAVPFSNPAHLPSGDGGIVRRHGLLHILLLRHRNLGRLVVHSLEGPRDPLHRGGPRQLDGPERGRRGGAAAAAEVVVDAERVLVDARPQHVLRQGRRAARLGVADLAALLVLEPQPHEGFPHLQGQRRAQVEAFGEVDLGVALQLLVALEQTVGLLHLAVLRTGLSRRGRG